MSKGHEFDELRDLLRSWNVSELLPHFKDENINIEELQIIKRHHLTEVLHNFTFGTRIRFEHHLERWRRWVNKPLQGSAAAAHCGGCRCIESPLQSHEPRETQRQDETIHQQQQQQPMHCPNQSESPDLLDEKSNILMAVAEPFAASNEIDALPIPMALNEQVDQPQKLEPTVLATKMDYDNDDGGVSVLSILQASGSKGQSLLDLRGQNTELLLEQRLLLIQLICNYYGLNQLHLTLQRSHLLEREILQLFPKERLSFYRTERRGKIYVKFTNMKRFKRASYDAKRLRDSENH